MPDNAGPHRVLDDGSPPLQISLHLRGAHPRLEPVPIAMEPDEVPGRGNPRGEPRTTLDLLADQEENGAGIGGGQDLENCRRALGMGTVVEGNADARAAGKDPGEAERLSSMGENRCQQGSYGGR